MPGNDDVRIPRINKVKAELYDKNNESERKGWDIKGTRTQRLRQKRNKENVEAEKRRESKGWCIRGMDENVKAEA